MRAKIANAAAFEPVERNAVIGVGAPSSTSGVQTWNGAAAILKQSPAPRSMIPNISASLETIVDAAAATLERFSEPQTPEISESPYSRIAELTAPSTK